MSLRPSQYSRFLSESFVQQLAQDYDAVPNLPDLCVAPGLISAFPQIETESALGFVCELYEKMHADLDKILEQRVIDRAFLDQKIQELKEHNQGVDYSSDDYQTPIGLLDSAGRMVLGQRDPAVDRNKIVVPDYLKGNQITLFGPPDTVKMSINAMNALHHRLPNEPDIVEELVEASGDVPRWGADNEDSKTPMMRHFLHACENLIGCYQKNIAFDDERRGKKYRLKNEKLAVPIKRIPGLALPDGNHLWKGAPIPLHLFDLAMHIFHNWSRPEALCLYVPKLENEEEAAYLCKLIRTAEELIVEQNPSYRIGSVKIFVVFENPRAIFRIAEMAEALHPYFVGGSLGWHDFLASTARLFKHDPNYRIPVKADPNIVINHIKESHLILKRCLEPINGICIGGMYGTLYEEGNSRSFQVSMVGYIKDVLTQMKRGLDGFWVAHPNFVRIGVALVEAWRRYEHNENDVSLEALISKLVTDPLEQQELRRFVFGPDVQGLNEEHPRYQRSVLAADLQESDVIANHHEEEVRYNIFQALQYLADWLCGNGCVALPAQLTNARGESVFVRVMDDLATTERSRWEVWAEVTHGRVSVAEFEHILAQEVSFLKANQDTQDRRIQVRWQGEAAQWYPIAVDIFRQLVLDRDPVEFVPELILPFTFDFVRNAEDPFALVKSLHPSKYMHFES